MRKLAFVLVLAFLAGGALLVRIELERRGTVAFECQLRNVGDSCAFSWR